MKKDIPLETIERWLRDRDCIVREAAANAMQGKDIPLETIELALRDNDCDVREAAANAMQGKGIPLETIERWLRDRDWIVRKAAANAMQGKGIPLETIERCLRDRDWIVRKAAANVYKSKGIKIPSIRTFEPPKTVYKKCLLGVIIAAEIPLDAQVRGGIGKKCRTNKAIITGIIGDICGEPVGISKYDKKTTYYVGDKVYVEDFDFSDEECSTGFHFFCTLEEAKDYN